MPLLLGPLVGKLIMGGIGLFMVNKIVNTVLDIRIVSRWHFSRLDHKIEKEKIAIVKLGRRLDGRHRPLPNKIKKKIMAIKSDLKKLPVENMPEEGNGGLDKIRRLSVPPTKSHHSPKPKSLSPPPAPSKEVTPAQKMLCKSNQHRYSQRCRDLRKEGKL